MVRGAWRCVPVRCCVSRPCVQVHSGRVGRHCDRGCGHGARRVVRGEGVVIDPWC